MWAWIITRSDNVVVSWKKFSIFLFSFLHLSAKIYNFPLEKALNEERRMAYEERIYFVVADKRD